MLALKIRLCINLVDKYYNLCYNNYRGDYCGINNNQMYVLR